MHITSIHWHYNMNELKTNDEQQQQQKKKLFMLIYTWETGALLNEHQRMYKSSRQLKWTLHEYIWIFVWLLRYAHCTRVLIVFGEMTTHWMTVNRE